MEAEAPKTSAAKYDKALIFRYFPEFARFIRENHLVAYIQEQIDLCRDFDLPIMKHLAHIPDNELVEMGIPGHTEFLEAAANNTLKQMLDKNLKTWDDDEMGILGREDIEAEDLTIGTNIRKKSLLKFLPLYTNDPFEIIEIIKEIDAYDAEALAAANNLYIKILTEKINAHLHFIEGVTTTTPAAIFIWDYDKKKEVYTNQKMTAILGYTTGEFEEMGDEIARRIIHPDDLQRVMAYNEALHTLKDGETRSIDSRAQHKNGEYIWLRSHMSVFKRDTDGNIKQVIGITLNVDEEKRNEEKLKQNTEELLEAQEMLSLGSYTLNIATDEVEATPEYFKIFGIDKEHFSRERVLANIHPSDQERVVRTREKAIKKNSVYDVEYRYVLNGKEKILWVRGEVYIRNGEKVMKGTVMDVTERRHIIQRLQRSEELYKEAQAMSHIGNWTWDLASNKLTWSDEMYRIYGLPLRTEIDIEALFAMNNPDDIQKMREIIGRSRQIHQPYDFFYRIILKSGEEKIVHAKGNVLVDNKGAAYKMYGTVQDVTKWQLLIEKLQRSETRYKQAQALAHMGDWEWHINDNRLVLTEELYRIYEFEQNDELISLKKIMSVVHPDDLPEVDEAIRQCLAGHRQFDVSYRIIIGDREKCLHSKGDIVVDDDGREVKMYGTTQDITKEYMAEQEVKTNREFIQKIANTSPSLLASYNVHTGRYIFINKAFEKVLGYNRDLLFTEGVSFLVNIVHPDDLPMIMEKNARALEEANRTAPADGEQEMTAEFEYRMKNSNGEYRWFHTYATIFDRNIEGKVEHVLNVSVDITDQKAAEQALHQKNIELLYSNANLEEFAYVASHDLKEPLRKISTFGDLILSSDKEKFSPDGKLYLEKIVSSAKRMQTMINDLMALSTITGNKTYEQQDLNEIVAEVVNVLEYNLKDKNATITYDNLPVINVVRPQFVQLFQNLISNSLKFSRPGVEPHIRITSARLNPTDAAAYGLTEKREYVMLRLEDNGIGFENEYAGKIFTIFQRLHGKSEYEGNGIGLSICRKVVENHKGVIHAQGVVNQGAVFTIVLPAYL